MYNIKLSSPAALATSNQSIIDFGAALENLNNAFSVGNYSLQSRSLNHEIKSDENAVYAKVDVPGVDPKDIKVRVEGRAIHVETPRGNAYFTIGARVDGDNTTAVVKHGQLTLTIPKRQAKTVAVTVEDLG